MRSPQQLVMSCAFVLRRASSKVPVIVASCSLRMKSNESGVSDRQHVDGLAFGIIAS